ncbi:MAG: YicC family protein [Saprospiraceae bacterium]|nr:YicC family protein [Saprospiraceae bacterium]
MTGYGRADISYKDKTFLVEVRSLNSKFTDVRFKLPNHYRDKELELRKMVSDQAERGKLEVSLEVKSTSGEEAYGLNFPLFKKYFKELSTLAEELNMPTGDMMQAIMRIPNVIATAEDHIDEAEWEAVIDVISQALKRFENFRKSEGKAMEEDLRLRIANIRSMLIQVNPLEKTRVDTLRQRLKQNLEEYLNKEHIDENRFEQEILYYLEKIDITEEKVRLEQHCLYFLEQLDQESKQNGRKLSFISQEMGREINTLGAKAYSSDIQRLVVGMKDELEKIKEQTANLV